MGINTTTATVENKIEKSAILLDYISLIEIEKEMK